MYTTLMPLCVHACYVLSVVSNFFNLTDHNLPGASVHEIPWARILEWLARPSSTGFSQPRIKPVLLMSPAGRFFTTSTTWEALTASLSSSNYETVFRLLKRQYSKWWRKHYGNKNLGLNPLLAETLIPLPNFSLLIWKMWMVILTFKVHTLQGCWKGWNESIHVKCLGQRLAHRKWL